MPPVKAEYFTKRHESLKGKKQPWLTYWQLLSEFVYTKKQSFFNEMTQGEFLNDKIFDNTGAKSRDTAASAMVGALWPNGARTFRIEEPFLFNLNQQRSEPVKRWYSFATNQVIEVMDNSKSGFISSLSEYTNDSLTFGTAGIGAFSTKDTTAPVLYKPYFVKNFAIEEGVNGFVNTFYTEKEYTVVQLIEEYGLENVSKKAAEAYQKQQFDDKFCVLHAIEPRQYRDFSSDLAKDMPFVSIHIELETKKILREGGFKEMPIYVNRFAKATGEIYGRSPAMAALPDILEANILREGIILANEIKLDPPMGMLDADILGNGSYDRSPGALNVFSVSGRIAQARRPSEVMEPLYDPGDLQPAYLRISELRETIANHFFIDRLLDLNNEVQQTFGEAQIRNKLRGETLNIIYRRQMDEILEPLITRTFNILWDEGLLGVIEGSEKDLELQELGFSPDQIQYIPQEVLSLAAAGEQVYKIKFISPAARIMQSDELQGYLQFSDYAASMGQLLPEILDNHDWDEIVQQISDLTGVPSDKLQSDDKIKEIREMRGQAQQAAQQLEARREMSEIARNEAQAQATMTPGATGAQVNKG